MFEGKRLAQQEAQALREQEEAEGKKQEVAREADQLTAMLQQQQAAGGRLREQVEAARTVTEGLQQEEKHVKEALAKVMIEAEIAKQELARTQAELSIEQREVDSVRAELRNIEYHHLSMSTVSKSLADSRALGAGSLVEQRGLSQKANALLGEQHQSLLTDFSNINEKTKVMEEECSRHRELHVANLEAISTAQTAKDAIVDDLKLLETKVSEARRERDTLEAERDEVGVGHSAVVIAKERLDAEHARLCAELEHVRKSLEDVRTLFRVEMAAAAEATGKTAKHKQMMEQEMQQKQDQQASIAKSHTEAMLASGRTGVALQQGLGPSADLEDWDGFVARAQESEDWDLLSKTESGFLATKYGKPADEGSVDHEAGTLAARALAPLAEGAEAPGGPPLGSEEIGEASPGGEAPVLEEPTGSPTPRSGGDGDPSGGAPRPGQAEVPAPLEECGASPEAEE